MCGESKVVVLIIILVVVRLIYRSVRCVRSRHVRSGRRDSEAEAKRSRFRQEDTRSISR